MTPPTFLKVDPERLVDVLEQHREKIYQNWFTALRQEWTGEAQKKKKLSFFEQKIADGQDLLSLLLAYSGKTEAYYQYICSFTNLEFINSPKYSVLDVFDEAAALEDSILNLFQDLQFSEDERQSLSLMVHKEILGLVKALLCSTADLLASLVDGGMRGYCQVDDEGRIVCADQEFQDLLKRARSRKPEPGEHLEELFVESDRAFFAKAFADPEATPPGSQRLHLAAYQKAPIPVGTELCPIVMDGQRRSWYVCLVDLSALVEREKEVYESLPVGLVQVDLQGNFRYANRKFSEILGLEQHEWQGKDLWEFLLDEEAREKVKKGIMERREGKQGEYETKFTRKSGKEVPVQIYAVPERNLQKEIIGSFAIIRSLEQEKASARVQKAVTGMHELMAKEEKWDKMLDKVIQEAKPFILYDLCIVSEISPDQKHIRRLRALPPIKNGMSHMGRWETPDEMTKWLKEQRETLIIDDLEAFLSQAEFAEVKKRPEIHWFIEKGYCSFIRLPIVQEHPLASVTFLSKTNAFYHETHQELLKALPLDKAVRLALYRKKEAEFKFIFELIKKISAEGDDFLKVAEILVDELSKHYDWENVALFRAEEDFSRFRLLYQRHKPKAEKNKPTTAPIPEGYEQPLDQGVLGYVYRTEEDVNIGNVKEDPRFKDIYVSPWASTDSKTEEEVRSELCLRIATQDAQFFLNIEEPKQDAFSDEELNALKVFRDEAKGILERSWLYLSLNEARESASDAIIGTDRKGRITSVNQAATSLLGYTEEEEIKGLSLKKFFQDVDLAEDAIANWYFPSQQVVWLNKAKEPVNLLLSGSTLQRKEFSGKIFIAKNLAEPDHTELLKNLGKLYQEIAIQMKTPLSLAFAWLHRLVKAQKKPDSKEAEILGKVIKQLRKVDLTFDRLSLADYDEKEGWVPTHKVLVSLETVLSQVKNDLPESDWERIIDSAPRPWPILRGDPFQLSFCVETILAHLLGVIPENEKIHLQVSSHNGRLVMKFSGVCPEVKGSELSRALVALAMGEKIIRRFMQNHDGDYQEKLDGNRTIFILDLPAVEGE